MMGKNKILIISIFSMVLIAGSMAASTTIMGAILGIDQNWSRLLSNEVNNRTSDDSNQGVKLRFKPKREDRENLVYIQTNVAKSVDGWVTTLDQFLEPYHNKSANRVPCSYTSGPGGDNQVCDVPVEEFYPCIAANKYNYAKGAPCIFLKLDKILNWQPQPYNSTENLPEDMPLDLKQFIRVVSGGPEANNLFVTCKGESEADEENLGPFQYIPRRGFPSYYFPDTNKEGYLSPLVAVLLEKPTKGVLINIECRLWARNIPQSGPGTSASVHLELMID